MVHSSGGGEATSADSHTKTPSRVHLAPQRGNRGKDPLLLPILRVDPRRELREKERERWGAEGSGGRRGLRDRPDVSFV